MVGTVPVTATRETRRSPREERTSLATHIKRKDMWRFQLGGEAMVGRGRSLQRPSDWSDKLSNEDEERRKTDLLEQYEAQQLARGKRGRPKWFKDVTDLIAGKRLERGDLHTPEEWTAHYVQQEQLDNQEQRPSRGDPNLRQLEKRHVQQRHPLNGDLILRNQALPRNDKSHAHTARGRRSLDPRLLSRSKRSQCRTRGRAPDSFADEPPVESGGRAQTLGASSNGAEEEGTVSRRWSGSSESTLRDDEEHEDPLLNPKQPEHTEFGLDESEPPAAVPKHPYKHSGAPTQRLEFEGADVPGDMDEEGVRAEWDKHKVEIHEEMRKAFDNYYETTDSEHPPNKGYRDLFMRIQNILHGMPAEELAAKDYPAKPDWESMAAWYLGKKLPEWQANVVAISQEAGAYNSKDPTAKIRKGFGNFPYHIGGQQSTQVYRVSVGNNAGKHGESLVRGMAGGEGTGGGGEAAGEAAALANEAEQLEAEAHLAETRAIAAREVANEAAARGIPPGGGVEGGEAAAIREAAAREADTCEAEFNEARARAVAARMAANRAAAAVPPPGGEATPPPGGEAAAQAKEAAVRQAEAREAEARQASIRAAAARVVVDNLPPGGARDAALRDAQEWDAEVLEAEERAAAARDVANGILPGGGLGTGAGGGLDPGAGRGGITGPALSSRAQALIDAGYGPFDEYEDGESESGTSMHPENGDAKDRSHHGHSGASHRERFEDYVNDLGFDLDRDRLESRPGGKAFVKMIDAYHSSPDKFLKEYRMDSATGYLAPKDRSRKQQKLVIENGTVKTEGTKQIPRVDPAMNLGMSKSGNARNEDTDDDSGYGSSGSTGQKQYGRPLAKNPAFQNGQQLVTPDAMVIEKDEHGRERKRPFHQVWEKGELKNPVFVNGYGNHHDKDGNPLPDLPTYSSGFQRGNYVPNHNFQHPGGISTDGWGTWHTPQGAFQNRADNGWGVPGKNGLIHSLSPHGNSLVPNGHVMNPDGSYNSFNRGLAGDRGFVPYGQSHFSNPLFDPRSGRPVYDSPGGAYGGYGHGRELGGIDGLGEFGNRGINPYSRGHFGSDFNRGVGSHAFPYGGSHSGLNGGVGSHAFPYGSNHSGFNGGVGSHAFPYSGNHSDFNGGVGSHAFPYSGNHSGFNGGVGGYGGRSHGYGDFDSSRGMGGLGRTNGLFGQPGYDNGAYNGVGGMGHGGVGGIPFAGGGGVGGIPVVGGGGGLGSNFGSSVPLSSGTSSVPLVAGGGGLGSNYSSSLPYYGDSLGSSALYSMPPLMEGGGGFGPSMAPVSYGDGLGSAGFDPSLAGLGKNYDAFGNDGYYNPELSNPGISNSLPFNSMAAAPPPPSGFDSMGPDMQYNDPLGGVGSQFPGGAMAQGMSDEYPQDIPNSDLGLQDRVPPLDNFGQEGYGQEDFGPGKGGAEGLGAGSFDADNLPHNGIGMGQKDNEDGWNENGEWSDPNDPSADGQGYDGNGQGYDDNGVYDNSGRGAEQQQPVGQGGDTQQTRDPWANNDRDWPKGDSNDIRNETLPDAPTDTAKGGDLVNDRDPNNPGPKNPFSPAAGDPTAMTSGTGRGQDGDSAAEADRGFEGDSLEEFNSDIGSETGDAPFHYDEDGNRYNDDGERVDDQGRLIDGQGRLIDEDGHLIDANGRLIDEESNFVNELGRYVNEDGYLINDDGDPVDEDGNLLPVDENGKVIHGDSFACGRCGDEFLETENEDVIQLDECGHRFCSQCWNEHLQEENERIEATKEEHQAMLDDTITQTDESSISIDPDRNYSVRCPSCGIPVDPDAAVAIPLSQIADEAQLCADEESEFERTMNVPEEGTVIESEATSEEDILDDEEPMTTDGTVVEEKPPQCAMCLKPVDKLDLAPLPTGEPFCRECLGTTKHPKGHLLPPELLAEMEGTEAAPVESRTEEAGSVVDGADNNVEGSPKVEEADSGQNLNTMSELPYVKMVTLDALVKAHVNGLRAYEDRFGKSEITVKFNNICGETEYPLSGFAWHINNPLRGQAIAAY